MREAKEFYQDCFKTFFTKRLASHVIFVMLAATILLLATDASVIPYALAFAGISIISYIKGGLNWYENSINEAARDLETADTTDKT